jgi:hypothetical protein
MCSNFNGKIYQIEKKKQGKKAKKNNGFVNHNLAR